MYVCGGEGVAFKHRLSPRRVDFRQGVAWFSTWTRCATSLTPESDGDNGVRRRRGEGISRVGGFVQQLLLLDV